MFGIGMQELVLIFVIALLVVGPKQLPELAKALGKGYAEFRRAFDEMKVSVERDLRTEEIRRTLLDLPPPPPPPGAPPAPPGGGPSSGEEARSPYPEVVEAFQVPKAPAAGTGPASPPAPPAAPAAGEEPRERA